MEFLLNLPWMLVTLFLNLLSKTHLYHFVASHLGYKVKNNLRINCIILRKVSWILKEIFILSKFNCFFQFVIHKNSCLLFFVNWLWLFPMDIHFTTHKYCSIFHFPYCRLANVVSINSSHIVYYNSYTEQPLHSELNTWITLMLKLFFLRTLSFIAFKQFIKKDFDL